MRELFRKNTHGKKTHASFTVTVVRARKIRTALRSNQIVGFVTVPAWKIKQNILLYAQDKKLMTRTDKFVEKMSNQCLPIKKTLCLYCLLSLVQFLAKRFKIFVSVVSFDNFVLFIYTRKFFKSLLARRRFVFL